MTATTVFSGLPCVVNRAAIRFSMRMLSLAMLAFGILCFDGRDTDNAANFMVALGVGSARPNPTVATAICELNWSPAVPVGKTKNTYVRAEKPLKEYAGKRDFARLRSLEVRLSGARAENSSFRSTRRAGFITICGWRWTES
jgi:hypothetical protein